MGGPVDGDLGEVEAHDAVIGRQRLFGHGVEHAGFDPFVAAARSVVSETSQRRSSASANRVDSLETQPVRRPSPVTDGNPPAPATAPAPPPTPHLSLPDPTRA